MRDEAKQRIISRAIADGVDDEGQYLTTTPPLPQHPPIADDLDDEGQHLSTTPPPPQHRPIADDIDDEGQHLSTTPPPPRHRPIADDIDDGGQHLPTTLLPPQQPPQCQRPSNPQQPPQPPPSFLESIKLYYYCAFFALLLVVLIRSLFFSRPTSTAPRPAAWSVLVSQNLSVSAEDFENATSSQHQSKEKCYRLPLQPRLSTELLLPYPINASIHTAILDQTGWLSDEQLILLFEHRKQASLSLRDVRDGMQWANQHLASMFSKGKFDKSSISKAINHFEARLSIALREVDELVALYSSMEECYKVFDAASAGALLTDRMIAQQEFAIKWQPRSLIFLSVCFHEWYEVPWKQKVKRREDARLGLAVLDREFRRVQQIKSLIDALQNVTKQCASEFSEINNPNLAEKVWERIWSCYKTSDIGNLWTGLLEFAEEDEDTLGLELTTEWCRH